MSAQAEMNHIVDLCIKADVETTEDVVEVLEEYFKTVVWSSIKAEWERMDEEERPLISTGLLRRVQVLKASTK